MPLVIALLKFKAKKVAPKLVHTNALDGGALAGGRAYDRQTRDERSTEVSTDHCGMHCNGLSSSEGLGIKKGKNNLNPALGKVLKKLHKLLSKMLRKSDFMKAFLRLQSKRRLKSVAISIGNDTRIDGWLNESEIFNLCHADIEDAYREVVGDNFKNIKVLEDSDDEDKDTLSVDKLVPTADEKMIIRQLECGYMPVVQLSKFTQTVGVIIFDWLFQVRHTLQEMSRSSFTTYEDISTDRNAKDLYSRKRSIQVMTHSAILSRPPSASSATTVETMKEEVQVAREVYVRRMAFRFGLTDEDGKDVKKLPQNVLHGAILHPLFPSTYMIGSTLLTEDQFEYGVSSLIDVIESRYELEEPDQDDVGEDSNDAFFARFSFSNNAKVSFQAREKASSEVNLFVRQYRKPEMMPKFKRTPNTKYLHGTESDTISDTTIAIGDKVEERGADLPSGKNLADYFNLEGEFLHIKFWMDHKKKFPMLWSYAVERSSSNPTEVSCETLFSESGYASNARRTRLKSVQFEREVNIAHNLQWVFFDIERAVDTFLYRQKHKKWDYAEGRDALMFMEQEAELFADRGGEESESDGESDEDEVEVVGTNEAQTSST